MFEMTFDKAAPIYTEEGRWYVGWFRMYNVKSEYYLGYDQSYMYKRSFKEPNKHSIFTQCWFNVCDVGPTLNQHWANISCLPVVNIHLSQHSVLC